MPSTHENQRRLRPARLTDAAALSALMRRTFMAGNSHCSSPENVAILLETMCAPKLQASEIRDPDTLTVIATSPQV